VTKLFFDGFFGQRTSGQRCREKQRDFVTMLDADAKLSWAPPGAALQRDMIWIPGGTFRIG
jgi:hypothetical protein